MKIHSSSVRRTGVNQLCIYLNSGTKTARVFLATCRRNFAEISLMTEVGITRRLTNGSVDTISVLRDLSRGNALTLTRVKVVEVQL